ncbi:polysaccharide deacetylase family protein [Microbispora sp. NPDC049125]|uniref:polysaccharide deacetylase family protein n=1 Tax=Microbispora sp. NPDC049125 TaxID=3154929 RepID=UPI0034667668
MPLKTMFKRLMALSLVTAAFVVSIPPLTSTAQAATRKTTVVLTFDDGTADHLAAARMLKARGLKGTFYVNSGRLGKPGSLTVAGVRSIAKAGNEIGGHTLHHVHLAHESNAVQQTEICDDRRALLDLGFKVRSFAYPFGEFDESSKETAMRCGYTSARMVNGVYRDNSCRSCPYAEKVSPPDLGAVRTTSQTGMPRTSATFRSFVTRAYRNGGGLVIFVFHTIDNNKKDQYSTSPKELSAFLDWVAKQKKAKNIDVRPLGDVIGGPVWPVPDVM